MCLYPNYTAATVQVLRFSFCTQLETTLPISSDTIDFVQISLGALMCLLVVIQCAREALQMYKARRNFRMNRYMNLLVREGMIYFLAYVNISTFIFHPDKLMANIADSILTFALVNVLVNAGDVPMIGWRAILAGVMNYIPAYTLSPRFILSLRRLYARDVRGGLGSDIDTAFGLTSLPGAGASAIVFANGGQNEGLEQGEGIQMEDREICSVGSGA